MEKLTELQREILNTMCFGAHEVLLGDIILQLQEYQKEEEDNPYSDGIEWGEF